MRKVVVDTNVYVSALIKKQGKPAQILRHIEKLELVTTEEILAELEEVLHRPHIQRKYQLTDNEIREYLNQLRRIVSVVQPRTRVEVIAADPDDDEFLSCALASGADYIVSGDPHLLNLQEYQGIRIVSPAAFLMILESEE